MHLVPRACCVGCQVYVALSHHNSRGWHCVARSMVAAPAASIGSVNIARTIRIIVHNSDAAQQFVVATYCCHMPRRIRPLHHYHSHSDYHQIKRNKKKKKFLKNVNKKKSKVKIGGTACGARLLIYKAAFVYLFLATIAICAKKRLAVYMRTLINAFWHCTQRNVKDIVTLL